jgi:DNA polymerase I-like protein with 3'-5' exonuclease and polymerase domains
MMRLTGREIRYLESHLHNSCTVNILEKILQKSGCSKLSETKVTKLPDICKYHYKIDPTYNLPI